MKRLAFIATTLLFIILACSRGPDSIELQATIDAAVAATVEAIPTPTPLPTATLSPTSTPAPTASPTPTPAPLLPFILQPEADIVGPEADTGPPSPIFASFRARFGAFRPLSGGSVSGSCLDDRYMGEVFLFAGSFVPEGAHAADGALLQISDNPELFKILGTQYGGDGNTTFALPNLTGLEPGGVHYLICTGGLMPPIHTSLPTPRTDFPSHEFLGRFGTHGVVKEEVQGYCAGGYTGEVILHAGVKQLPGTAFAHGQEVPISQYNTLYAQLGTMYGGDGRVAVGLPDLRGLEPGGVNYLVCLNGEWPSRNYYPDGGVSRPSKPSRPDDYSGMADQFVARFGGGAIFDDTGKEGGAYEIQGATYRTECADRYYGEVLMIAGWYPPEGSSFSHGQVLDISVEEQSFSPLYSLVGTNYGGDPKEYTLEDYRRGELPNFSLFRLPDLRGLEPGGVNFAICIYAEHYPPRG